MTSSSKQLAVMEHRVVKGHQSFFQVLVQAVKAGHIEGRPVLTRPGVFVEQPSPVDILWRLARGVREHPIELTDGDEMQYSAV